ncbi:STAS domain-containing protein [Sorangium sp. So ce131]|uniref:STAS domain-containing protein n=1 Tax=Sorangium sp. So ce131 TaxID=3133282 RepID=UPI003F5FF64B
MKLLCKSADERFPSARGSQPDLNERPRRERQDEARFDAAHHAGFGAPRSFEPTPREPAPREPAELAAMNLAEGRKARASGAPPAAADFFEAGISALPDGSFKLGNDLAFSLHAEAAECAYLGGQIERAESLLDVLGAEARSDLERARAHELRIAVLVTQGRLDDALRLGAAALAMLGEPLPDEGPARKAAADAEVAAARAALGARRLRDLLDEPETADGRTRAALRLLMALTLPAAMVSPPLCTFIAAKQVNLSLERGHGGASPYGYMAYAWVAARVFRRYDEAYELGEIALELCERSGQHELSCRMRLLLGAHISVFTKHLLSSLDLFAEAHEAGLRAGDPTHVSQTCVHTSLVRFGLGDECEGVRAEVDRFLTLVKDAREELALAPLTSVRRALDDLIGTTGTTQATGTTHATRGAPGGAALEDAAHGEERSAPRHGAVAFIEHALRQQICFLFEDHEGALRMGSLAEASGKGGVGDHLATEVYFYTCLTLLSPALARGRQVITASLSSYRDRLAEWAERCPDNFRHKHLLVRAESARAAGEELAAMKLYDQAIASAKANGFVRDEALANELCAKFHLASGREKIAHVYMTDAYEGYLRWGATAKVGQLSRKYPHLVPQAARRSRPGRSPESERPMSPEAPCAGSSGAAGVPHGASHALAAEVARLDAALRDVNERLAAELAARQRAEQERAALEEQVRRAQRERPELSAPLIPIADRILAMPLAGEMIPARVAEVLDSTVASAAERRAKIVLFDVTGARRVEAGVANALMQAAGALQLLGARVVITGIRPDAERALGELGIDLSAVVTRGTLQSGLTYALELAGGARQRRGGARQRRRVARQRGRVVRQRKVRPSR